MKHLKLFFFAMLLLIGTNSFAQQTIFKVPNSQLTGEGKYYMQLNTFLQSEINHFWFNGMYGVYKDIEVGLTLINNTGGENVNNNLGYGINAQYKLTLNTDHNLHLGGVYTNTGAFRFFGSITANKLLTKANISAGLFYQNEKMAGENMLGVMATIDYPVINDKIRVKAEFSNGDNIGSGLNVGGQYEISKNMLAGIGINLIHEVDNYNPVILQLHYNF